MRRSVQCRKASHPNLVIENLEKSVNHLQELFGGSFMLDLPGDNWHACLIEVGGLIIELFEPKHFMLHGRIGPHFLGIEYEVDMEEARAAVADHNIAIMRDIVHAIHTDPADGFGVDYEFFGGSFYGPDAPYVKTHTHSADYWAAHPIGYTGFIGYTHAVHDLNAASAFLQSFLGAQTAYEIPRDALGARAIGLKVANDICELISPIEEGELQREMMTAGGQGIRSILFGVKDIAQTRRYFASQGVRLTEGSAPERLAIDPRDNLGILIEFQQQT